MFASQASDPRFVEAVKNRALFELKDAPKALDLIKSMVELLAEFRVEGVERNFMEKVQQAIGMYGDKVGDPDVFPTDVPQEELLKAFAKLGTQQKSGGILAQLPEGAGLGESQTDGKILVKRCQPAIEMLVPLFRMFNITACNLQSLKNGMRVRTKGKEVVAQRRSIFHTGGGSGSSSKSTKSESNSDYLSNPAEGASPTLG